MSFKLPAIWIIGILILIQQQIIYKLFTNYLQATHFNGCKLSSDELL